MTPAIITKQVTVCNATQNDFKNKAIRASLSVSIGISGLSESVCPIRCPVARAQIFSMDLINYTTPKCFFVLSIIF